MRRFLFLTLLSASCRTNALAPIADLTGTWVRPASVPGSFFQFTLTQVGDSLSGGGTYSIEAGAHGGMTVRGRYAPPAVQLEIVQEGVGSRTFVGDVAALGSRMTGTLADSLGHEATVTFVRQ